MAAQSKSTIQEVLIEDTEEQAAPVVVDDGPVIVQDATVSARVKGTWTMYYGNRKWDFVDNQRYDLPRDLFNYLRRYGNIYDTL